MSEHSQASRVVSMLWPAAILAAFLATTIQSVRHPVTEGYDLQWAALWLCFVTTVWVGHRIAGVNALFGLWLAGAGAGLGMIVLSGTLVPSVLALCLVLAAFSAGDTLLRIFRFKTDERVEWFAVAVPIGFAAFSFMALVLSLGQLMRPFLVRGGVALLAAAGLWRILPEGRRAIAMRHSAYMSGEIALPLTLILPVLLSTLAWAVAPEIQFDALNVHLAAPRIYAEHGGFVDLPYFFHSYFVRLLDFLFAFCLVLHGPGVVKLLVWMMGVFSGCLVFRLGRRISGQAAGLWAAGLFYSAPLVAWLSTTGYVDMGVVLFTLACLVCFLNWRNRRDNGSFLAAAILAGAAVGTKLNAAFVLPVLIVTAAPVLRQWRVAGAAVVSFSLMALPPYALVYSLTANPFFPAANALFHSPLAPVGTGLMNSADFGIGTSLTALVRLPFELVYRTSAFGEGLPAGAFGVALLLAVPAVLRSRSTEVRLLWAVVVASFGLWAFTFQHARYLAACLGPAAALAVCGFKDDSSGIRVEKLMVAAALILQACVLPVVFWNIPDRIPVAVATGFESSVAFLSRSLPGFDAVVVVNRLTKPGDRILGLGTENLRYHLAAPIETVAESLERGPVAVMSRSADPGADLARMLVQGRFSHLLLNREAMQRSRNSASYLDARFLARYARLEFSDRTTLVYRICLSENCVSEAHVSEAH